MVSGKFLTCRQCFAEVPGIGIDVLQEHWKICPGFREQEREERTMGPEKKIRWTITGEGVPLENLSSTWKALNTVVEEALWRGLRVEVAEVEEEDR